eukprot:765611-Karenia_brevis.AAC.1
MGHGPVQISSRLSWLDGQVTRPGGPERPGGRGQGLESFKNLKGMAPHTCTTITHSLPPWPEGPDRWPGGHVGPEGRDQGLACHKVGVRGLKQEGKARSRNNKMEPEAPATVVCAMPEANRPQ